MAAVGWLVVFLALAIAAAAGAVAWALRERRLHLDSEADRVLLLGRLATADRALGVLDAELASARAALVRAQQEAREAGHRAEIAALPDSQVVADLAAALAARRAPSPGAGPDVATCDTAPDLTALARRESGTVPAGDVLPGGVGGPGGVGRPLAP